MLNIIAVMLVFFDLLFIVCIFVMSLKAFRDLTLVEYECFNMYGKKKCIINFLTRGTEIFSHTLFLLSNN